MNIGLSTDNSLAIIRLPIAAYILNNLETMVSEISLLQLPTIYSELNFYL